MFLGLYSQLAPDLDPECHGSHGIIIITRGIFPRVNPGIIREHETNQRLGLSSSDQ